MTVYYGADKAGGAGLRVERLAAPLPQATTEPLFHISGGLVNVKLLVGEVTEAIPAGTNQSTLLHETLPITAAASISGYGLGRLLSLDTSFTDVLKTGASPGGAMSAIATPDGAGWLFAPGDINLQCDGSLAGQIRWLLFYHPLDPGAHVVAAA